MFARPSALRKSNRSRQKRSVQTLNQLEEDAFDASLRTHKLKGDLAGCWASSAGYDLRIVFQFVQQDESEAILLLSVGTHDEVY